ncbi:hypothetical protein N7470_009883 [Penicillium chermesinum]|nr:hypothetical protein N7470_009883 [Penicillium chermesinum]
MIVLQGLEGGVGEPDDFTNVAFHLESLRSTCEPSPSLRGKLALCLEQAMEQVNTPSQHEMERQLEKNAQMPLFNPDEEFSMFIFDQQSLGQMMYPWQI